MYPQEFAGFPKNLIQKPGFWRYCGTGWGVSTPCKHVLYKPQDHETYYYYKQVKTIYGGSDGHFWVFVEGGSDDIAQEIQSLENKIAALQKQKSYLEEVAAQIQYPAGSMFIGKYNAEQYMLVKTAKSLFNFVGMTGDVLGASCLPGDIEKEKVAEVIKSAFYPLKKP